MTPLVERLLSLRPEEPGVYLMKDEGGRIIYVGKAKSLKKRVSQYFLRPQEGKVKAMRDSVSSFDFIQVHSEKEALVLEMNLIKEHRPRFNVVLMDDSHYPYIALRTKEARLFLSRKAGKEKGTIYFGPFPNSGDCYRTIALLNSLFPTRKCRSLPAKPCLYHGMGQCLAPCLGKVDEEETRKVAEGIRKFLEGDAEEVLRSLRARMKEASESLRFEEAGELRDKIAAVERTISRQRVEEMGDRTARDVLAYCEREGYLALALLTYRGGRLLGKRAKAFPSFGPPEEQVLELVESLYQEEEPPKELVLTLPGAKEELEALYPGLHVLSPKEGRLHEMQDIALLNARQELDRHFLSARLEEGEEEMLEELGRLLHVPFPERIDLFDNSHLQGAAPVGAMVSFKNGKPFKGEYRKFHLKEDEAGDDFASMRDIVERRYRPSVEEGRPLPSLILVDGGLPQVHAALEGLGRIPVEIPVFGLYKNERHETEGILDKEGTLYPLDRKSPLFFLLMRMQDEVHRFAISVHRTERGRKMVSSLFAGIPGIGPRREELLRKHYPTLESLRSASVEELMQILPRDLAVMVHALGEGKDGEGS